MANTTTREVAAKHRSNKKRMKRNLRTQRENAKGFVSHRVTFGRESR